MEAIEIRLHNYLINESGGLQLSSTWGTAKAQIRQQEPRRLDTVSDLGTMNRKPFEISSLTAEIFVAIE